MKNQKLELTWIGKDDNKKIEPRILIEDKEKSYGDENTKNMLIHGDNLLALKAIEDKFTNKIKCIYIDPPYNTNAATNGMYDDNVEHSIWLNLMKSRLELLKKLLSDNGAIFIQIDNTEYAYLKVLCDEIFGRNNFISTITCKVKAPSGVASGAQVIFDCSEYILIYAKDRTNFTYRHLNEDVEIVDENSKTSTFYNYILKKINYDNLELIKEFDGEKLYKVKEENFEIERMISQKKEDYFNNYEDVFRIAALSGGREKIIKTYLDTVETGNNLFVFEHTPSKGKNTGKLCKDLIYKKGGVLFLKDFSKRDNEKRAVIKQQHITSIFYNDWWQAIASEGGVTLNNGKKPEKLIKTILDMVTIEGDYVLDSFSGSGTTCAVAHKMNRKWIGIELGEQCYTHCKKRLDNVINGDRTGISKEINWQGGGGYKFYELAPSLLVKDKFGNWIISEEYNGNMLIQAICKQEKFDYIENQDKYWKQGMASEDDYIYVTTNYVSLEYLRSIEEDMKENESLLICAKSYQAECEDKYDNITIKKIPQSILKNCEYGTENYNLNVVENGESNEEDIDE